MSRAACIDSHLVTFWCLFVSFGPAPHIFYQRGERVGEPVCTIHGHCPGYLAVGPAGQGGTGEHAPEPHPSCLHIDPAARSVTEGEPHPETQAVGAI